MKNIIIKSIVVLACVAGFLACNKVSSYTSVPFAAIDARSITVKEDTLINIPVRVYNKTGDCSITYTAIDGTAVNGLDYEFLNPSGVLNFPEGVYEQGILVKIIGQPGVYTGNTSFEIALKSATNNIAFSPVSTCKITISDVDHPLTSLFGKYTISGLTVDTSTGQLAYPKWEFEMSAVEGNPTKVEVSDLTPLTSAYGPYLDGSVAVIGTVSEDLKTIVFDTPQEVEATGTPWGVKEPFIFFAHEDPDQRWAQARRRSFGRHRSCWLWFRQESWQPCWFRFHCTLRHRQERPCRFRP